MFTYRCLFLFGTPILLSCLLCIDFNAQEAQTESEVVYTDWGEYSNYTLKKLSTLGKPVLLTKTPFDLWATSKWTPRLLRDKHIPFILAKQGNESVFKYYALDQPLVTARDVLPFRDVLIPGDHFFELMEGEGHTYYSYASGDIKLLKLDNLYTEESLKEVTFPNQVGPVQVNFWFSTRNVTAYTHYDTSENLHVTIYGKKKFLLFPPSAHHQLKLYPCLHQFYRQVQVDVLRSPAPVAPLEVVLRPGQVLYIPPYWFHCVISLEPTISLNVWSSSRAFVVMEEVYRSPIPFEEGWGEAKMAGALRYYVELLVGSAAGGVGAARFVREVVYSRYEGVVNTGAFPKKEKEEAEENDRGRRRVCLTGPPESVLDPESLSRIREQHRRTADLLLGIDPLAVRHINLGNYIEHLAWRVFGEKDLAQLLFFLSCFS